MPKVIIENVRCSYVFVRERRKSDDPNKEGKFSIQPIIPKDHPQIKQIKKAIKAAATEKFGDVKMTMLKLPLRDGDEERDSEEYNGCYFLNANSAKRPGIMNRDNQTPDLEDLEDYCYSGARFHVSVNFYAYNFEGKKGVAVGLNNVMLVGKGERLDGSTSASDDFKAYSNDEFEDSDEDDEGDDW